VVSFKSFISLAVMCALIFSMLGQLFIDLSSENVISTLVIALATSVTLAYLYWVDAYKITPISAIIILALLFTGLFGALLFQTLNINPVIKYLFIPVYTFSKLAFYLFLTLFIHYVYLTFFKSTNKSSTIKFFDLKRILSNLGLYNIPSVKAIWLLSIVGLLALVLGKTLSSTLGRAIFNLHFFMWFPYIIIFYVQKFGSNYANIKKQYFFISLFFGLSVLLGIAFNSRSIIIEGLVNILLVATILLLQNNRRHEIRFYIKFSFLILLSLGMLKPFSSFSEAMLTARLEKENSTPIRMLTTTFDIYLNSRNSTLNNEKNQQNYKIYLDYDEEYIENGIINRFVLTKYHDNAFYYASMLSKYGQLEIKKHLIKSLVAILPQPIIDKLGIDLNKLEILNSTTDILVHETTGRRLGGLKVPSSFADLEVAFGLFAPFVFIGLVLILFKLVELFGINSQNYGYIVAFPFFAIAADLIIMLLPVKSIQGVIYLLFRGFGEIILLFSMFIYFTSLVFPHFKIIHTYEDEKGNV